MIEKAYTPHEIAKYCDVTPRTVNQWINEGKITAFRTPGNHSRVKQTELINFLKKFQMPIPSELLPNGNKKNILIVDDEQGIVNLIKRLLLPDPQFEVDVAFDGFMAGQKFIQKKPDLIILDLRMPRVDGDSLCQAIRNDKENKDVRILIISGIQDEERIKKILKIGADDFLQKPFTNEALLQKINELLEHKTNQ
jgi:excisionase family DNA binding protein